MKKTGLRLMWWLAAISYMALVYLSLRIAPVLWDRMYSILGGKLIFLIYFSGVLVCLLCLLYMIFVKNDRSINNYMFFVIFVYFYGVLTLTSKYQADKIHLVEFSVLSVIIYNALKIDMDRFDMRLYVAGALICFIAILIDENIQRFLPSRVFDWMDILRGTASSIITLLAIRILILQKPSEGRIRRHGET